MRPSPLKFCWHRLCSWVGMNNQQRKDHKMAGHADNKKQTAEVKDGARTAHVDERGV